MICHKCKKTIPDNISICPHCGTLIKRHSNNKIVKNKFIAEDQTNLIGGLTSKDTTSFMHLKRINKKNNNDLNLKDFNSFVDYKEAKRKENTQSTLENEASPSEKEENTSFKKSQKFSSILKSNNKNKNYESIASFKQRLSQENNNSSGAIRSKRGPSLITIKKERTNTNTANTNNKVVVHKIPLIEKNKKKVVGFKDVVMIGMAVIVWILVICFALFNNKPEYYFNTDNNVGVVSDEIDETYSSLKGVSKSGQIGGQASLGVTSIVYDYQYLQQINIKNIDDVHRLIANDSIKQKNNCPNDIIKIEEEIVDNYGIVAANLCEINLDLAEELRDVIKYIFDNYPKARGFLTNITLGNVSGVSYIAAFMPVFTFATSNNNTGYPVAIKTQIILNAKYFLNASKLKNSVSYGAKSGYFPKNASSSSTVAHEFGHYLSYVAMLKYHKTEKLNFVTASNSKKLYEVYDDFNKGNFSYELIQEAYVKYQERIGSTLTFDGFRGSISTYAMAKNETGNYIYDETIAEAFHDCYLNGTNASEASQLIVETLIEKL